MGLLLHKPAIREIFTAKNPIGVLHIGLRNLFPPRDHVLLHSSFPILSSSYAAERVSSFVLVRNCFPGLRGNGSEGAFKNHGSEGAF